MTSAGNDPNMSSAPPPLPPSRPRSWLPPPAPTTAGPGLDPRRVQRPVRPGGRHSLRRFPVRHRIGAEKRNVDVGAARRRRAALVLERHPTFNPSQVWAALDYTATKGVITGEGTGDPDKLLRVATEPAPPAAPTGLTAAVAPTTGVGSGQVKLTWTAPPTPAGPLTDYVIERSSDGTTGWTVVDDGVSTATTATVGGLRTAPPTGSGSRPKRTWTVRPRVQATPVWTPDAPLFLSATVSRAAGVGPFDVQLTWTALRQRVGGLRLPHRVVRRRRHVDEGRRRRVNGDVLHREGIGRRHELHVPVAAVNRVGAGAWQLGQAPPRRRSRPPPTVTAAVAPAAGVGSGEVKLSWTAPASNGSAITDYQIQSSLDGTTWSAVDDPVSAATGHTLANLTGGTAYQFRVAAKNAIGTGPWSASVTATPVGPPAAPSGLAVAVAPADGVGSGRVKLSWTPAAGNGSAITDYLVERSIDGVTWTAVDDGVSTSTTSTVGGLINGTQYRFRVAASNAVGTGSWSATVTATPVGSPEAPSELTAQVAPATGVGSGEVKLSWTTPANDGSAVTDYLIERSAGRHDVDGGRRQGVDVDHLDGGRVDQRNPVPVPGCRLQRGGLGAWSATVSATPAGLPAAPTG